MYYSAIAFIMSVLATCFTLHDPMTDAFVAAVLGIVVLSTGLVPLVTSGFLHRFWAAFGKLGRGL